MQVHGDNLRQKETSDVKYADAEARKFLTEIRKEYDRWQAANEALKGPTKTPAPGDAEIIAQRTKLFTAYKDFIDQQRYAEKFDSRSNQKNPICDDVVAHLFNNVRTHLISNWEGGVLHGLEKGFLL